MTLAYENTYWLLAHADLVVSNNEINSRDVNIEGLCLPVECRRERHGLCSGMSNHDLEEPGSFFYL